MTRGIARVTAAAPWFSRTIVSTLVMLVGATVEGEEAADCEAVAIGERDTDARFDVCVALGARPGGGPPHAASPATARAGAIHRHPPRNAVVDRGTG
jgi:hypothetical protein